MYTSVSVKCGFRKFPAFPMGAQSSREGAQPGGWLLGSSLRGVGVPAASTSQLVLHSFLVIVLLQVRLLCLLQVLQVLGDGEEAGRSRLSRAATCPLGSRVPAPDDPARAAGRCAHPPASGFAGQ